MYRQINGKRYNTDAAKKITSRSHEALGNPKHFTETLYRKSTGEFFLHCVGDEGSIYARHAKNKDYPGEKIIPLTYTEADQFSALYMDPEDYERIFHPATSGPGKKTQVNIYLTDQELQLVKREAAERMISSSAVIEKLIQNYL